MFRPPSMQTSMTFSSRLPPVLHLETPFSTPSLELSPQKSNSIQVLDGMIDDIISSVEAAERAEFFELLSDASSARKGVEYLMIRNMAISSLSLGSRSGSTEALTKSPFSENEREVELVRKTDSVATRLLHRHTPPRPRTFQKIPNINKLKRHLVSPDQTEDEAIGSLRQRRQISVKHYSDATPSMHCHICCRSSKNIKVHACARIKEAICRKVVCSRCFIDNNWVHHEGWVCSHCRGICPARSQCFTYGRSNLRRKLQASKRKLEKSQKFDNLVLGVKTPPMGLSNKNDFAFSDSAPIFMPRISLTEALGSHRNGENDDKAVGP